MCDLGNDKGAAPEAALTSVPKQRVAHLYKRLPTLLLGVCH